MYARVSVIPGNQTEQVIDFLNNASDYEDGEMKGAYIMVDEKKQKVLTITLWETKEQAEASRPEARLILKELEKITGEPIESEHYQVAAYF